MAGEAPGTAELLPPPVPSRYEHTLVSSRRRWGVSSRCPCVYASFNRAANRSAAGHASGARYAWRRDSHGDDSLRERSTATSRRAWRPRTRSASTGGNSRGISIYLTGKSRLRSGTHGNPLQEREASGALRGAGPCQTQARIGQCEEAAGALERPGGGGLRYRAAGRSTPPLDGRSARPGRTGFGGGPSSGVLSRPGFEPASRRWGGRLVPSDHGPHRIHR